MITQLQNTVFWNAFVFVVFFFFFFTQDCPDIYIPSSKLQRQNSFNIFLTSKQKKNITPLFSKYHKHSE